MTLEYNLLEQPLIRARQVANRETEYFTLPALFMALKQDAIHDFPAVRPHQRHPWHAFLVQLAAIAMNNAERAEPFESEKAWKDALLALTAEQPDGAAWCLIAPPDQPALMQPPVPESNTSNWKNTFHAPDEIDMLVTSKNHDLKTARMREAEADDWLMALISLQTQEGFLGAGNYGISRMNGGFSSRPAVGIVPKGNWGKRWLRDVQRILASRSEIAEQQGLNAHGGHALLWLIPWNGENSLSFNSLDPFYIEICRRIRLVPLSTHSGIGAIATGTKTSRIDAKMRNGITGDPWMPINIAQEKALTVGGNGFDYKLAVDILTDAFSKPIAQQPVESDGKKGLSLLAQTVTRGQGKTEGYHERRIPISPKTRLLMLRGETDELAKIAKERVQEINQIRSVLWAALALLFDKGASKDRFSDSAKNTASEFSKSFEQKEDARFFIALNEEIESDTPDEERMKWRLSMMDSAEALLKHAFIAGPQSGEQRYRAQAAALSRFYAGMRSEKTIPDLAIHLKAQIANKEQIHD